MRLLALALAAAAVLAAGMTSSDASSQAAVTVAIDVDVTGNGPRTVGPLEDCVRLDAGSELEIDIVVTDPGIPADVGVKAWQFNLLYDENVVRVADHDPRMLLTQAVGSELLTALSEPTPDSDGSFTSAAVDFSQAFNIEPQGAQETGPGVIARVTLSGVAEGATDLTLDNLALVGADNRPVSIGSVLEAAVSVDTACEPPPPPPPPPTPPPADGANGQTGTETPLPGAPSPGPETVVSPPADGSADGQTPDPSTPVLGGTPLSGDEGDAEGDASGAGETDGGGLSGGAWAGIGVGIGAAVLAASGAGWFVLRRRRAGGPPTSGGETGPA